MMNTEQDPAVAPENARAESGRHPAPPLLFAGIGHCDNREWDEALASFDRVLELQPKNDLAHSYRGLCLLALSDEAGAAALWSRRGFSDNGMFRVRIAEFIEQSWLESGRFMGESSLRVPGAGRWSQRKALHNFYRRNYAGILPWISPPPVENDVEAFLGATALEMLRHYGAARQYLEAFVPRRAEWPDALVSLNARLDLRAGNIRQAARDFASVVVMGPEDFGINYYMGVVCLAYEKADVARQYFRRAFTNYMVDTLEFQWWQIEQVLLNPPANTPVAGLETSPSA